jgi:hypothetical protein
MRSVARVSVALLLLVACGKSSSSPSSSSKASADSPPTTFKSTPGEAPAAPVPHACDLFSPDVAKTVLGDDAHETRRAQPNKHMTQCQYQGKGGSATVMAGDWPFISTMLGHGKSTPVPDLGPDAVTFGGMLYCHKGNVGLEVSAFTQAGEFTGSAAARQNAADDDFQVKVAKAIMAKL